MVIPSTLKGEVCFASTDVEFIHFTKEVNMLREVRMVTITPSEYPVNKTRTKGKKRGPHSCRVVLVLTKENMLRSRDDQLGLVDSSA